MLKIKELEFKYRKSNDGIYDVNLYFSKPNVVGVIGSNGSGKSTLFKLITGFFNPPKNSVFINGKEFIDNMLYCKSHLGICFDNPSLLGKKTVIENLRYFNIFFKQPEDRIFEILTDLELTKYIDYSVKKLSFGLKQRVNIALLLLRNADILILDEPYNGLDISSIKALNHVIKKYKEEKLIIISGHFISEIEQISDHIVIFKDGKVVFNNVNCYGTSLKYTLYKCDKTTKNLKNLINIKNTYFEKNGECYFFLNSTQIDFVRLFINIEMIREVSSVKDIYNLL